MTLEERRTKIRIVTLYPYYFYVYRASRYYDWLDDREVRYIVKLGSSFGEEDKIRFKFSQDLVAFKLTFGL